MRGQVHGRGRRSREGSVRVLPSLRHRISRHAGERDGSGGIMHKKQKTRPPRG